MTEETKAPLPEPHYGMTYDKETDEPRPVTLDDIRERGYALPDETIVLVDYIKKLQSDVEALDRRIEELERVCRHVKTQMWYSREKAESALNVVLLTEMPKPEKCQDCREPNNYSHGFTCDKCKNKVDGFFVSQKIKK